MSYDVDLCIDTGGEHPASIVDCGNYTWNVSPMFRLALGGKGLDDLHEQNCGEMLPRLRQALAHMDAMENRAAYRAMDPANGWGDFEGAREYLRGIYERCAEHPKASIRVG